MQRQPVLSRLVNPVLGLLLCLLVALGGPAVALAAPGELDASFGTGGTVITSFGGADVASAVAIQPDGKLVVAGRTNIAGNTVFALARYNANGGLDPAFGTGGLVTTDFGSTDQAFAVALQPDGKIVTAGRRGSDVIVARYNANGTPDALFGPTNTPGRVVTNFGATEQALALVLQPDGKIVVAGRTNKPAPSGNFDFALARYEAAGTLDLTFGTLGLVTTDFGGSVDRAFAMALQPDGKLVVVGDSDANFALARYNPDGSLDAGFGSGGKVITSFGGIDQASAVSLQPDGKIVVAGQTDTGISIDFALARYNPDGSLDGAFGSGGRITTNFTGTSDDLGSAVALQSDGKIVVGGTSDDNFALARYTPAGILDTTFGSAGLVTTNLGGEDVLHAVTIQPDGAIVAVGESADRFALARYQAFGLLSLRLVLSPEAITEFKAGEPFHFDLFIDNPRPQETADLYFAVLLPSAAAGPPFNCPGGDPLVVFGPGFSVVPTCISGDPQAFVPLTPGKVIPSGLTVTTDFFSGVWPDATPLGAYTFFVALARPGTLDILAVASTTARLVP
jgi:uncharacterized delta-60 repeat protein